MGNVFRKIGLISIAIVLLIGTIAFIEASGHIAFGLLMIALLLIAVFSVAEIVEENKFLNRLTELYREAEKIYKDSLKVEREYSSNLNEILNRVIYSIEQTHKVQREFLVEETNNLIAIDKKMNSVLEQTIKATRTRKV